VLLEKAKREGGREKNGGRYRERGGDREMEKLAGRQRDSVRKRNIYIEKEKGRDKWRMRDR